MSCKQMTRNIMRLHQQRHSACNVLQSRQQHSEPVAAPITPHPITITPATAAAAAAAAAPGAISMQIPAVEQIPTPAPAAGKKPDFLNSATPPLRSDYSMEACNIRRSWAEHKTGVKLPQMAKWLDNDMDTNIFRGNIEMPMGLIKLPVAPVGPLNFLGEQARGEFVAPFATIEGALTASVQRGINALNASGGVQTRTGKQICSRGPCFVTGSPDQAIQLAQWVKKNKDVLQKEVVSKVSSHAVLDDIIPIYDFDAAHIVFMYKTGDACGQNVVTVCSWNIINWIMKNAGQAVPEVNIKNCWVEANATSDKKPGAFNILHGRGMSTEAKVVIPESVLIEKLSVTAEEYLHFYGYTLRITQKCTAGGGMHVNPANSLTAMYLATGQDAACVADSIAGSDFSAMKHTGEGGGVEFKLSFENLLVGSVGGGTALPTQHEGLEMMGCVGVGKVRKLAEIMTGFALALDISTTSAVVCGKFATGHDALGRNRPGQ